MRRPSNKTLRSLLALVLVGVIAYFFGKALLSNLDALKDVDFAINGWVVAAILTFALAVVFSGTLWGWMVSDLSGKKIPGIEAVRVHCSSWLLKYVPGQVGSVVNKIAWAKGIGIPATLVTLTFVYENVFLIIGSLVPPTLILLVAGQLDLTGNTAFLAALASLIPLLALTNRKFFSWMSNLLARKALKRNIPREYFLTSGQSLRYQLWYLIPRIINGVGLIALAKTMINPPSEAYLPLACAYIIAGAVGILAIAVPSGIGVRESVFVFLALPYISAQEAIVLSLAARLWATLADVIVAGVYVSLNIYMKRRKAAGPGDPALLEGKES